MSGAAIGRVSCGPSITLDRAHAVCEQAEQDLEEALSDREHLAQQALNPETSAPAPAMCRRAEPDRYHPLVVRLRRHLHAEHETTADRDDSDLQIHVGPP